MTDQNSEGTLASMLADVVKWVPESCGFRGDDRYHAVTAVLSIEDADSLNDKLQVHDQLLNSTPGIFKVRMLPA